MGHDIYAHKKTGAEQEALEAEMSAKFSTNDYGTVDGVEWLTRFENYSDQVNVAYLRRSAGNPLNALIYVALDCVKDCYGGVSGYGIAKVFPKQIVQQAFDYIADALYPETVKERLASNPVRSVAYVRGVIDTNGLLPSYRQELAQWNEVEIAELSFLRQCLAYMEAEGTDSLEIYFG